jgi:hypothetical protein
MLRIISGAAPSAQGRMSNYLSGVGCMGFLGNTEA